MKIIGFISGAILLFLLTFSCEKEIDLKAQAPPGQLYANAIFNPDSVFRVFISYSILITAPIEEIHDKLDDATESIVIIRDGNGTLIDTLEFIRGVYSDLNNSFLVFESIEGFRPLAEETYELYVHQTAIKNSKTISTSTRLPSFFNPIQASKGSPSRIVTGEDQTFSIELI